MNLRQTGDFHSAPSGMENSGHLCPRKFHAQPHAPHVLEFQRLTSSMMCFQGPKNEAYRARGCLGLRYLKYKTHGFSNGGHAMNSKHQAAWRSYACGPLQVILSLELTAGSVIRVWARVWGEEDRKHVALSLGNARACRATIALLANRVKVARTVCPGTPNFKVKPLVRQKPGPRLAHTWTSKVPIIMAQCPKKERIGSRGSIILDHFGSPGRPHMRRSCKLYPLTC